MMGASVWGRREGINLVARNSRIVEAIERYLEKTSSFCFVFLIGKNKNVTVLYVIVVAIIDLILLEMLWFVVEGKNIILKKLYYHYKKVFSCPPIFLGVSNN